MVILDNGHGYDTPGKCSPDGRLREWLYTRQLTRLISRRLDACGIENVLLVPGDTDMPLAMRCRKANSIAARNPGSVLVSIHTNAAGNGAEWTLAHGWSAFVAPGASERSCRLASLITGQASIQDLLGNRRTPPEGFWRANLAICRDTTCPAVLTENLFHDNWSDVEYMLSADGLSVLADIHVCAIKEYFTGL